MGGVQTADKRVCVPVFAVESNVGDLFHESLKLQNQSLKLRNETEQAHLDFIRTDLELCLTFATVAETAYSMGHREHAERTIANAEKGYSDMLRFFLRAKGMTSDIEEELQSKFKHLRERLDGLRATNVILATSTPNRSSLVR